MDSASASHSLAHRIAFGSCYNPNRGDQIWATIRRFQPNQLLLLGDQIYADFHPKYSYLQRSSPEGMAIEYEKFHAQPAWNRLIRGLSHGWQATYDDHDFGVNNADKHFKNRNLSMEMFRSFHRIGPNTFFPEFAEDNDGVYSSRSYAFPTQTGETFTYQVILLDGRSNKDRSGTPNGTFLGDRQWRWLESELQQAAQTADLILLGSAIQVIPTEKLTEESWGEFPHERERLLNMVAKVSDRTNILLISGDIHMAEVSQVRCHSDEGGGRNYSLLEWTSSGFSHTFPYITRLDGSGVGAEQKKAMIKSRGFLSSLLFWLYQTSYVAPYREFKYRDMYHKIHFALIDIEEPDKSEDQEQPEQRVVLRIVNYLGETVIQRVVSLARSKRNRSRRFGDEKDAQQIDWNQDPVVCEPFWGKPTAFRNLATRATLALFILVVGVLPLVTVLWLIGASLYYVFFGGAELARRRRIEEQYQKLKRQ